MERGGNCSGRLVHDDLDFIEWVVRGKPTSVPDVWWALGCRVHIEAAQAGLRTASDIMLILTVRGHRLLSKRISWRLDSPLGRR